MYTDNETRQIILYNWLSSFATFDSMWKRVLSTLAPHHSLPTHRNQA